ncbi:hypothetical protein WR25_26767 [Diploscapter pachys]|uniref:NADH dehydrogenase [ubiquinone] 1 beta subcomplex subunit 10 n=1 Tax=Diploscapter pachys TaxID=2018661 RepID=A0A2A2LJ36_9BILA|nr:hypothetical protein WR25_26767 [Diploscapter pachys]
MGDEVRRDWWKKEKEEWEAYWKVRDLDSRGTIFPRMKYYVHKWWDAPSTWFRERVVEPLHEKNRLPYYHFKYARVPEIDQCGVNDFGCIHEAREQFRKDKFVDGYILQILKMRYDRCMVYNFPNPAPCAQTVEDLEEADLNFFIKYGELGSEGDVKDAYMKQKHRLIWERRHPEIMEERAQKYAEHKEQLKNGQFDHSFWKKGLFYMDKKNYEAPYEFHLQKALFEGDKPLSKDWEYYKKVSEDPEFDKEQGKTSNVRMW